MIRSLTISTVILTLLTFAAGCNTEKLWVDHQKPQGPMSTMDATAGINLPDIQIINVQEVDIVEEVLTHRAMYKKSLTVLRDYYREQGYNNKRQWADAELADLSRVRPFNYVLSAEIPVSSLRPRHAIVEADEMYQRGVELMKKGGHGLPVLYRQDLMREALQVFTEMITKYPGSDKIDDAAFCCGEILKEYFQNQERLAVKWYERAHTWDPGTPHPSLFQAAVVYDFRLHDRAKALELYHRVLEEETANKSNSAFASRRIFELTEGMEQLHEPRRPAGSDTFAAPPASGSNTLGSKPRSADSDWSDPAEGRVESPTDQVAADGLVPVVELGPDQDD